MGRATIDLTGMKFNHLTVIKELGIPEGRRLHYLLCECECGNRKEILKSMVKTGKTKACGCMCGVGAGGYTGMTHGMSKKNIFKRWHNMKSRCCNPNNANYKNYGGRGIKVCDEWIRSFEQFYKDMGDAPTGLSLDRIDNNGNYCKENCRWATIEQQSNNKRSNHLITYKSETKTLAEFERKYGLNKGVIHARIRECDWDIDKIMTSKVQKKFGRNN